MISFYAKQARGMMASWVIRRGVTEAADLKKFRAAGYKYNADLSAKGKPAFTRDKIPNATR